MYILGQIGVGEADLVGCEGAKVQSNRETFHVTSFLYPQLEVCVQVIRLAGHAGMYI